MRGRVPFRIVIAEPYAPQAIDRLRQIGDVVVLEDSSPQSLLSVIHDADALLVRSKAHVTARIIEAAPKLKVIARASTNTDHIDLRAARRKSIAVVYAPHIAVTSTAQFSLAMILALRRRLPQLDRFIREGSFESLRAPAGREMGHEVLGLLGMDPVAEHLARMCQAPLARAPFISILKAACPCRHPSTPCPSMNSSPRQTSCRSTFPLTPTRGTSSTLRESRS